MFNRKGFTLLEVVAVLAVLGVLAAILVPNIGTINNSAIDTKVKSDLQVVDSALALYWSQNNYTYPAALNSLKPTYLPAAFDGSVYTYNVVANGYSLKHTAKNITSPGSAQ